MTKKQDSQPVYATPDVTKAQGGAVAAFAAAVVGAHLAGIEGTALYVLTAGAAVISVALIVADASIRRARANGPWK